MNIKPCPFCKKTKTKVEQKSGPYGHRVTLSVRCNACHSRGPTVSDTAKGNAKIDFNKLTEKAIELWNAASIS